MATMNFSTNGTSDLREKIARRAYEIWQQAGCPEGQSDTHWLQAEAELAAPTRAPKQQPAPRRTQPSVRRGNLVAS